MLLTTVKLSNKKNGRGYPPFPYRLEQYSNDGPNALPCSEFAVARCVYSYPFGHSNEVGFFNKLTVIQSL